MCSKCCSTTSFFYPFIDVIHYVTGTTSYIIENSIPFVEKTGRRKHSHCRNALRKVIYFPSPLASELLGCAGPETKVFFWQLGLLTSGETFTLKTMLCEKIFPLIYRMNTASNYLPPSHNLTDSLYKTLFYLENWRNPELTLYNI